MNTDIITKILGEKVPDDIIRVISTYFIQKIPKDDIRFVSLNSFLYYKNLQTKTVNYSSVSKLLLYKIYTFQGIKNGYFVLRNFPDWYIEYNFSIYDRINAIRFWIKDNKCEVPVDGYWVEKKM
jgi:hypothetical protein